ncbi:stage II sporulation protein P [Bacillus sp. SCS-151]|uniref:stage II sporulation protein P n=1 Tax=Nanhaiella sioensis TaxID=3115293 RepID=UPI003977F171
MRFERGQGMVMTIKGSNIKKTIIIMMLGCMMIFSVTAILTSLKPKYRISSSSINDLTTSLTSESLLYLLSLENHYFSQILSTKPETNFPSLLFEMATSINLDDPRSLLGSELPGYALYDSKIIVAGDGTNYTNLPYESAPPIEVLLAERDASVQNMEEMEGGTEGTEKVTPPVLTTNGKDVVYIYHTHSRESYLPHLEGVTDPDKAYHSEVNVTLVGERLASELEKRGIGVQLDQTDIMGQLIANKLKFFQAYDQSKPLVQSAMTNNRDLQYFIDIHRDANRKEQTTHVINGKSYAKTAFVIGGNNARYERNLKLADDLHQLLQQKYPGLSRGVFEWSGEGQNGMYNQDLSDNVMLIEFGGVDNTFEELNRTAAAIADVFSEYYWQAEKVSTESDTTAQ